ncbi:MAG: hypothetical protein J6V70_07060, partial [Kiritimatiellae bacterium]|nr:hypothetical protein [Kiritimatiellia bacterium]
DVLVLHVNWAVRRPVLQNNWAAWRPRLAVTLNNSTAYIALQCFICRRHASWCYAPLHSAERCFI